MIKRVALAALGAVVVVVGGWYGIFWRSETNHLATAKKQLQQVEQSVTSDQATVASLTGQVSLAKKEKPVLAELVGLLPYGPSLDELYDTVNRAAASAGVTLSSINTPAPTGWGQPGGASSAAPSPTASASGAQVIAMSLSVEGNPPAILRFIESLNHSPRLYVVSSFTITGGKAGGGTTLSVEAFYQSTASVSPVYPGDGGQLSGS
jgi:hypothetical protein